MISKHRPTAFRVEQVLRRLPPAALSLPVLKDRQAIAVGGPVPGDPTGPVGDGPALVAITASRGPAER